MKIRTTVIVLALCILIPGRSPAAENDDATLRLAVGEPRYKDKIVEIRPGEILSARTGRAVSAETVFRDLRRADFVYVGETHNSLPMHDVQVQVLRALGEAGGRELAVGVEMFPASAQAVLDRWSGGALAEEDFLRESRWYVTWNFHWGYYSGIFGFARQNDLPVFGLNVAREIISKIRMRGWESLSEAEKALVPEPGLTNSDHRTLMKAVFSAEDMPPQMRGVGFEAVFEGLYRAQSAWDEVMAANAVRVSENGKRQVVVLAGSGHLIYNLGINRRVFEKTGRPFRTVVCVTVPKERLSVAVSRSLADYIWGLAEEDRPAYPSIGLRLKTFAGLANPVLEAKPVDGMALGRDFEKGDVVLSVDGSSFSDINELRMRLAQYAWGEEAAFRLLRAGQEKTVILKFEPPAIVPSGRIEKDFPVASRSEEAPAEPLARLRAQLERLWRNRDGTAGIAVKHLESGRELLINADDLFPMASVFKLPVLVELMAQVREGRLSLEDEIDLVPTDLHLGSGVLADLVAPGIRLSVRNLILLMMTVSDNSAADLLLAKVGAENVNRRLRGLGIEGISVSRSCQELILDVYGLDYETYKDKPAEEIEAVYEELLKKDPEFAAEARRSFSLQEEDRSAPRAMNVLLERVFRKNILDEASCQTILDIMAKCQTGAGRIKGRLPSGTEVAHKTGTLSGSFNDCGIIFLPDGRGHVALSIMTKDFHRMRSADIESLIAETAKFVYDYFYFF